MALCPTRCPSCPNTSRLVLSEGPAPAQFLFLGAGPGKHEDRSGRPYSGPAGEELTNTYLALARLHREDVHIGSAQLCWTGDDKVQEARLLACARHHLPALLDRVRPEVLVLMGGATCRIADERIRLDMHHGRPRWGSVLGGAYECWLWPSYEPALGMRETSRMTQLIEDFTHLGEWMRGEWAAPAPGLEEREKDYRLVHTWEELESYLNCLPAVLEMAMDTEDHGGKPWSVQISHTPHTGRMILAENTALIRRFSAWANESSTSWIFHHAVHDLDVAARLGIFIARYRDTLQEAFQLCSLPQGLKALVYRLFGATMHSWEDTVRPASVRAVVDWLEEGMAAVSGTLDESIVHTLNRGICQDCGHMHLRNACKRCGCPIPVKESGRITYRRVEHRPGAVEAILKHVLTYTVQTEEADEPYDPWEAMDRMRVEGLRGKKPESWEWEWLEGRIGKAPILGIAHCPADQALLYAAGDADWTGQVAAELEKQRGSARWQIADEDRDI